MIAKHDVHKAESGIWLEYKLVAELTRRINTYSYFYFNKYNF